jgi:hypothetical protein
MSSPASLRDSTQITLPADVPDDLRAAVDREFTVTLVEHDGRTQVVGSPVVIKEVNRFLTRHGVTVQ